MKNRGKWFESKIKNVKPKEERENWAVVVDQLVELLLPAPEVCGSKPVIGKLLYRTFVYSQLQ